MINVIGDIMEKNNRWQFKGVKIVSEDKFDDNTPQTKGMKRFAAIAKNNNGITVNGPAIINNTSLSLLVFMKEASPLLCKKNNQKSVNGKRIRISINKPGIAPISICFLITPYIVNKIANEIEMMLIAEPSNVINLNGHLECFTIAKKAVSINVKILFFVSPNFLFG